MKKKLFIILGVLLCMPNVVNALELEQVWSKSLNGNNFDELVDVVITDDNNYVAVGYSESTDLPGIVNAGGRDAIVVMYDEDGNFKWINNYGTSATDYFYSVQVSKDNYIYAVGYSSSYPLIVKYDMEGKLVTSNVLEGSGKFYNLIENKDGAIIGVGRNNNDGFMVFFDQNLNILKSTSFGGSEIDVFNNVYSMNDGTYIVDGYTKSHDITGYENPDFKTEAYFVAKMDFDGNIKWLKYINDSETAGYPYLKGTKTSDEGVIILNSNSNSNDTKIYKYDTSGNLVWNYVVDGNGKDTLVSVKEFEDGSILVSGFTSSTDLVIDSNVIVRDGISVLLDKNGNLKWIEQYNEGAAFGFASLEIDKIGDLVFICVYDSSVDDKSTRGVSLMKFKITYDIEKNESSNGTYDVIQNGDKGTITVTPDEGYMVDDVVVKDSQDKNVDVTEVEKNKFEFIITDDVTTDVTFERDYKITLNVGDNGSATSEKLEDNNGRIKVVPDEGYEVDEVIIKDSTGKVLVYEEKDGIYNFKLTDDVTVTVTFKEGQKEVVKGEEENPKTADAFIYYACAIVCSLFGVWSVEQYRKNIKA